MKKKVLLIASVFAASTLFAQDLTSRKGETYLPEANDWAISFDATPFLNYAGGFLGGNSSAPTLNSVNGMPWNIRGKMFKDENTAYRVGIRLGFGSVTDREMIGDAYATAAPTFPSLPAMVEDSYKAGSNNIVLSGGLEMRRGNTRLQGYYGGELMIGMMGSKDTYTYGNALAASGTIIVTANGGDETNFGSNIGFTDTYGNQARMTEYKTSTMMIGLRGFIGVEYFILPKISIGGEFGWGLGFSSTSESMTWESADFTGTPSVNSQTFDNSKDGSFMIDGDINDGLNQNFGGSGSLNIIFHF